jgi:hypothetical protein
LEETEARRLEFIEERKRKIEETAAKEEAALERKRALEITNKKQNTKFCKYCKIHIQSDFMEKHVLGKKHLSAVDQAKLTTGEEDSKISEDKDDGNKKAKATKIKQVQKCFYVLMVKRMQRLGTKYEETHPPKDSPHKGRMNKMIQDLKNAYSLKHHEQTEKTLVELIKLLNPKNPQIENDQHVLRQTGGIDSIMRIGTDVAAPSRFVITLMYITCLVLFCLLLKRYLLLVNNSQQTLYISSCQIG